MNRLSEKTSLKLKGIVGSPGICLARAYVFRRHLDVPKTSIDEAKISGEIARLEAAVEFTKNAISCTQREAMTKHGPKYAAIFDSHLLMLSDPMFIPEVIKKIKSEKKNVESILRETLDKIYAQFSLIEDRYLRERAIDMQDVGDRLLRHLLGVDGPAKEIGNRPFVLIAQEITPSELLDFSQGDLKGICLDSGGATSHVAILAGALSIPALFGLVDLSKVAHTGDLVLLDTRNEGTVILHPSEEIVGETERILQNFQEEGFLPEEPKTADGLAPIVGANIVRIEELPLLEKLKVDRIGLFRSEFLFMECVDPPSETFQEDIYRKVIRSARKMTVLRTIDIGSDKPVKYFPIHKETNPSMGFRSIRFTLSRPDILVPQLRAMIRASSEGPTRIIFPMISVSTELGAIDQVWKKCLDEVSPSKSPEWGIMLEVPSAVFMMDTISRFTKYISLGTNDLLQFFYAVDRSNERLTGLADPFCVPFLRFLFYTLATAKAEGVTVGICGEMAGDPFGFAALLGLGIDEFSMRPSSLKQIKRLIPKINRREISSFINQILTSDEEIDLKFEMLKNFPSIFQELEK